MIDFWSLGPTAASLALRASGFSLRQADRLVRLKIRYARGEFRELTEAQRCLARLRFLRWLADRGRFDDGEPASHRIDERSAR